MRAGLLAIAPALLGGCLEAPSPPDPSSTDGGETGAGADVGDLVMLTFDDYPVSGILRDRSGNYRHADAVNSTPTPGSLGSVYGQARRISATGATFLMRDPGLLVDRGLTIEAWVRSQVGGAAFVLFSNRRPDAVPELDYGVEVSPAGRLRFAVNAGTNDVIEVEAADGVIPVDTWTHVAVSWDRSTVRFFVGGDEVDAQALAADTVASSGRNTFAIGSMPDGTLSLTGAVDELKVSSWAKRREHVEASMRFDSTVLIGRCGDGFIEEDEVCVAGALCCDASCRPADDPACEGTCQDGACIPAESARVSEDLVALYEFEDGGDVGTISESSGQTPIPLTVTDTAGVSQGAGFLTIFAETRLEATAADSLRVKSACAQRDELTLEAWVAPATVEQAGPARILTYGYGIGGQNFVLGQDGAMYVARVRTPGTDSNGEPMVGSAVGDVVPGALTHVVATAGGGHKRLYVNGRLRGIGVLPGGFSNWNESFALGVGNETAVGGRLWTGDLHRVAVYCRELTALQVAQHYAAGAAP